MASHDFLQFDYIDRVRCGFVASIDIVLVVNLVLDIEPEFGQFSKAIVVAAEFLVGIHGAVTVDDEVHVLDFGILNDEITEEGIFRVEAGFKHRQDVSIRKDFDCGFFQNSTP